MARRSNEYPQHMFSWRNKAKNKILFVCNCLPTHQNPPYPKYFLTIWNSIFFFFSKWQIYHDQVGQTGLSKKIRPRSDCSKEQSDLGLHCLPVNLHILGTPFVGKIALFKLYDVVISVVWVFTVTVCKTVRRIL